MSNISLFTVHSPEYRVDSEPDHKAIGKVVDDEIKKHFMGQTIVARGVSSSEHPGKSVDELIELIKQLGTDRYNPARVGDRYENIEGKHIDLFGFRRKITPKLELFADVVWGFYHSAKAVHGYPVRIDILTIYDADQLTTVTHQYEGRTDVKRDGFSFKDPANKNEALKAIIKITE